MKIETLLDYMHEKHSRILNILRLLKEIGFPYVELQNYVIERDIKVVEPKTDLAETMGSMDSAQNQEKVQAAASQPISKK